MKTLLIIISNILCYNTHLSRQIDNIKGLLMLLIFCIIITFIIAYNSNNTPKNKR